MIFGNINNEFFDRQVAILPKPLGAALRFIQQTDLDAHEAGRFPMTLEGVDMFLQVMDITTSPRPEHKPEIHRKYIDVQYIVSGGCEKAGYYNDAGNGVVADDRLNTEKDILFYENDPAAPESSVILTPGSYAIYLPWDVHVPGQCTDDGPCALRKVVIKVPVNACV